MSTLKKIGAVSVAVAALGAASLTSSAPAEARGWGAPFAAGLVGGLAAGAIIGGVASPAYGYGYDRGYGAYAATSPYGYEPLPVYDPCYRSQQPVYDPYGNYAGYRTVRVCN